MVAAGEACCWGFTVVSQRIQYQKVERGARETVQGMMVEMSDEAR